MKYICFSGVMIISTLLILEILMILLEPYLFQGFYQYDRHLGFMVRPYTNGTNKFGFNDQDYSFRKPKGTVRILFVGDSFSWAGGKDKNYTALLEKKFEEYYGKHRVDIINAGYPMTHTHEQLAMLKKYGLQYQPDIVFLGFFAGNDFADADPYRKRIVVNDTYFDINPRHELILFGYPIIAKSRLWSFLKQKFIVWKERNKTHAQQNTQSKQADTKNGACSFSKEAFLNIERARLKFCNISSHQAGTYEKNIDFIFQSLSQMQNLAIANQIRLFVGIYPDEFQVNEKLQLQLFRDFGLEKTNYDLEFMQTLLSEYLDANRIPYVDLLKAFQTHGKTEPLYLCRNTHWNQAGNELAANIIFQYLLPQIDSVMEDKR